MGKPGSIGSCGVSVPPGFGDVTAWVHSPIGGHSVRAHRVQGHPGGGCKGATPSCPPEAVSSDTIGNRVCPNADNVSHAPPHQPAGIAKPAVWFEGVRIAGPPKRMSVVYNGSSQECLRRQGVAPLTPAAVARWV